MIFYCKVTGKMCR